jgi:hypothetical protein
MNDKIYLTRQDDTLRYRAIAQRTLAQDTVCVSIHVALLVSAARRSDQAELQRQIRDALSRFIPSVDWVFSTLHRDANPTVGYEQINVKASARIPSAQNFNLNDRARQASREGLTLSGAIVDYSLPVSLVNRVVHELRGEIVGTVLHELADFERQTGRKWRIGDIEFGIGGRSDEYTAKGASRSSGYEDLLDPDGEGLSGAERISLIAEITLRALAEK